MNSLVNRGPGSESFEDGSRSGKAIMLPMSIPPQQSRAMNDMHHAQIRKQCKTSIEATNAYPLCRANYKLCNAQDAPFV